MTSIAGWRKHGGNGVGNKFPPVSTSVFQQFVLVPAIEKAGGIRPFARKYKLDVASVYRSKTGDRVHDKVAAAVGFEKIIMWQKK